MNLFFKEQKKISVIMPSYLSFYEGCATNRAVKFNRAVDSFLSNVYLQKELIIVSDGCRITNELYHHYHNKKNIKLIKLDKQPLFSGNVRQAGLEAATGNYICYLDTDDIIKSDHLSCVVNEFKKHRKCDWIYFNDLYKQNFTGSEYGTRHTELKLGSIGTSCIAHKKSTSISWQGFDGYNHDWHFIEKLRTTHPHYLKVDTCGYVVCHVKGQTDF